MRVAPLSRYAAGALLAATCAALAGCGKEVVESRPQTVSGGTVAQGKKLVAQYQCGSCHVIPGVPDAQGTSGPSLATFGRHAYIAGVAPNAPDPLIAWIIDPPAMKPGTAMPSVGVSSNEARHIAAFLYTLR